MADGILDGMAVCRRAARVGREEEFEALRSAYADVERGAARVVLLGGEAGSGKTRLIADFLDEIPGVPVISGNCVELSQAAVPFLPLASALRVLAQERSGDEMATLVSGAAGPLLQLLPRLQSEAMVENGPDPLKLFEAVPELLDRLAPRGPAVLIFEDLHWADASTLDLVRFLTLSSLKGRLLVFTFRNDEMRRRHPMRPVLAELSRLSEVERIEIDPLDDDEVVELVNGLLPPGAMRPPLHQIIRRADGNPFFVEELVTCCAQGAPALATQLGDLLLNRLDRLPEAATAVAEVIAVTGRRASHRLIEKVAAMDADALIGGLRIALDDGAIVADPTGEYYGFRHALLQEAAYEGMPAGARRALHQRIAQTLTEDPSLAEGGAQAAAGEIAFHAERAGDVDTAYAASIRAAQRAAESFAVVESYMQFERAVGLHAEASPEVRIDEPELRRQASRAAYFVGNYQRSADHLRAALAATPPDQVEASVRLLNTLGEVLKFHADDEGSLVASEQALALAGHEPSAARGEALAHLAFKHMLHERYAESIVVGTEALEMCRSFGSRTGEIRAIEALGCSRTIAGLDVDQGLDELRLGVRLADELDDFEYIAHIGVNYGAALYFCGRVAESRRWDQECVEKYERRGQAGAVIDFQRTNLAWSLIDAGDWDTADRLLTRMRFNQFRGLGRIHRQICAAILATARGQYVEAQAFADGARQDASSAESMQYLAPLAWVSMVIASALNDEVSLKSAVEQLLDFDAVPPVLRYYGDLARVLVDQELDAGTDLDHCVGLLDELDRRVVGSAEGAPDGGQGTLSYEQTRLWIAAERQRALGVTDPKAWQVALGASRDYSSVTDVLYLQWRYAQALVEAGEDATGVLIPAFTRADELGSPLAGDLAALARRARIRLPGVARDAVGGVVDHGLTDREREVLELIARGSTNRQIAEELFISAKTASVHVSNILGKLGVANRTEAAKVAHDLGIGVSS